MINYWSDSLHHIYLLIVVHQMINKILPAVQQWALEEGLFRIVEHLVVAVVLVKALKHLFTIESRGKTGIKHYLLKLLLRLTGKLAYFNNKKEEELEKESIKSVEAALNKKKVRLVFDKLPEKGLKRDQLLEILDSRVGADINPTEGKTFAYVY